MTPEYKYTFRLQAPPDVIKRFADAGELASTSIDNFQQRVEFPFEPNKINNSAPTAKHQRQILFFESLPINYELAVSRSSIKIGPSTHLHEGELQLASQKFMRKFDHFPIPKSVAEKIKPEEQAEFVRIGRNCQKAKNAIIDGWENKSKRRTGESYFIHPLRVFLRGLANMESVKPEERSVFHVSLLSCILHDAKEDL